MSNPEIDLLSIKRGTVTAPAGCGKTHLIANALGRHSEAKPILVLTHTNAGVAALRARLDRAGVSPRRYRLSTIDGWSMRLASMFPQRGGCETKVLELKNPGHDYPAIRNAAINLLCGNHISDIIAATYSRLIVDEYQDCSYPQHAIVMAVAEVLPVCVLGDPLQAIFGFGGDKLPDWSSEVCEGLPLIGELKNPWRWTNAGTPEFGEWLLSIRHNLLSCQPIDLKTAPKNVQWVETDGKDDHTKRLDAINAMRRVREHKVIVIADSRNKRGQQLFASQIRGASTVEAVDLRDVTDFAASFDPGSRSAFPSVISFANKVMTGINYADLVARLKSIHAKTNRLEPSHAELACFDMLQKKDYQSTADLLVALNSQAGTHVYRPAVFRACLRALQMCAGDSGVTFSNAAIQMREQNRLIGRPLPGVAVGSTLLLKGLEAECAIILETDLMNANNLYVAMTRGAISLAVCSGSSIINT